MREIDRGYPMLYKRTASRWRMRRLSTTGLVVLAILVAAAVTVLALFPPQKPPIRQYRIGEQGLAEEERLRRVHLEEIGLMEIGGYSVSAQELADALGRLPPYQRYYYSNPEKVEVFAQNYALVHLLARQAADAGLDADPLVRLALEEELAARYKADWLASAVKASDLPQGDKDSAARAALLEERRQAAWAAHLKKLEASLEP